MADTKSQKQSVYNDNKHYIIQYYQVTIQHQAGVAAMEVFLPRCM